MDLLAEAQALARSMLIKEALIQKIERKPILAMNLPADTQDGPMSVLLEVENENLALKISNQQVGSVPPDSILCITRNPVNGKISLIAVGVLLPLEDASQENNKPDTTDPTKT